jgi:hypothetical protein
MAVDVGDAAALNGAAVFAVLRRRKWLLLASILLCPLLTLIAIAQLTPRYTATGTLLYDASEYKLREMQSILRIDPITDAVMASQAEVLRGMPVIEQVTSRLNLQTTRNSMRPCARGRGRNECCPRSGEWCPNPRRRRPASSPGQRWVGHAMPL